MAANPLVRMATRATAAAGGAASDAGAGAAVPAVAYAPAGVTVSTFALKARDGDAVESPDAPAAGGRKKFKKHRGGAKIQLGRVTDDDGA